MRNATTYVVHLLVRGASNVLSRNATNTHYTFTFIFDSCCELKAGQHIASLGAQNKRNK